MQVGCVRSDSERPVLNMTLFNNHKTFLSLRTKRTAISGKERWATRWHCTDTLRSKKKKRKKGGGAG